MTGEQLKLNGIARVSANNRSFMDRARVVLMDLARCLPEFTSENLTEACKAENILPANPNAWGAVLRSAAQSKLIVWTGRVTPNGIPSAHSRFVKVWRGA